MMHAAARALLLLSLLATTLAWSFWGGDEDSEAAEAVQPKVEAEVEAPAIKADGGDYTQQTLNRINKEEFEKKMEEAIRAHEAHHLSHDSHFDDIGEHNVEFDHEAFMGDQAEEFKNLTPAESKEKLAKIATKIDTNADSSIDVEELTQWIVETQNRSIIRRTEEFWASSNPEQKAELSWDEYRAIQYGFLTDEHITDRERRWVLEDDVDPDTLKQFQQLELRDRRRWTVADRDKNLQLTEEEFKAFLHPEHYSHMYSVNRDETMADLDTDGDGQLSLAEFVHHLYGDTKEVADWDSAGLQFRTWRDTNGDGAIDKEELMLWIHPRDFDQHRAEADHLVRAADTDGDLRLSVAEVLDSYSLFVSSQATDFGQDLRYHHDEL